MNYYELIEYADMHLSYNAAGKAIKDLCKCIQNPTLIGVNISIRYSHIFIYNYATLDRLPVPVRIVTAIRRHGQL